MDGTVSSMHCRAMLMETAAEEKIISNEQSFCIHVRRVIRRELTFSQLRTDIRILPPIIPLMWVLAG